MELQVINIMLHPGKIWYSFNLDRFQGQVEKARKSVILLLLSLDHTIGISQILILYCILYYEF